MRKVTSMCKSAKQASRKLASLETGIRNSALELIASSLKDSEKTIMKANRIDVENAKAKGLSVSFIDRLLINPRRFREMVDTALNISGLPDPVGELIQMRRRPNGLEIGKVRVPIGVIGIIYEARPNVSLDAGCLCLKSGNSVILRGGSDAIHSNRAIVDAMQRALVKAGIPEGSLHLLDDTSHEAVKLLLQADEYVDLIIPRGGEGLIKFVAENSRVPVIKHYKGICHIYVDSKADLKIAKQVCYNAKVQRPGVCNAMETMLVHKSVAGRFLKSMLSMFEDAGVELRGGDITRKLVPGIKKATGKDWATEYLDLILSVKVVPGLEDAVNHINTFGSRHSEAIITRDLDNARKFVREVDSSCVYVNASTRFTDGGEFGLGAEIGISTDKLHARGPMGLEELTTYKYIIYGDGQTRN